jgi:hypothetical protein
LQSKPQNIAASDVPALLGPGFDALRRPVWVFDDIRKRKLYANRAAIELWGAASLDELLAPRLLRPVAGHPHAHGRHRRRIEGGDVVEERWTFYPNGEPVAVQTAISRIALPGGGHAMLFEAVVIEPLVEEQRAIEALRHTSACWSRCTTRTASACSATPRPWRTIPARACGSPSSSPMVDAGGALWTSALAGEAIEGAFRMITAQGERWHGLAARRTPDPVTGSPASWSTRQTSPKRSRRSQPWPRRASGPRPPWPPVRISWPI